MSITRITIVYVMGTIAGSVMMNMTNGEGLKLIDSGVDNSIIDLFLRESNAIENEFSEEAFEDARKAWDFAVSIASLNCFIFNDDFVIGVHRILMDRLDSWITGGYRACRVTVGGRMCPEPVLVQPLMDDWFDDMNASIPIVKEQPHAKQYHAEKMHVRFEKIHPFEDGNGRTGRILMNIHRLLLGTLVTVIKDSEKHHYYKWFE